MREQHNNSNKKITIPLAVIIDILEEVWPEVDEVDYNSGPSSPPSEALCISETLSEVKHKILEYVANNS